MIEPIKEIFLILGRIVTILPLMLFMTIFMGKRAIGELPVFDFLIILTLGAVVGADIADPNIHHFPTAVAIILIAFLQRLVAKWKISNRFVGNLITFKPTVVIQDGKLLNENMKNIRYSIDNVLQMLREKDVFDVSEVETAIIEASGSLSVLKKPQKSMVTVEDLNITKATSSITFPLILEGTIYSSILHDLNLDEEWLQKKLIEQGITDPKQVFFASINPLHQLHISLKDENPLLVPTIKH